MKRFLLIAAVTLSLGALVSACATDVQGADDEGPTGSGGDPGAGGMTGAGANPASGGTTGTNTGGNTGPGSGGATTGPGAGGGGPECTFDGQSTAMAGDCMAACEILFCCMIPPRCPGVDPPDHETVVSGCVPICQQQQALIAVVNGDNCDSTVSTIRAADTTGQFADTCDNGP